MARTKAKKTTKKKATARKPAKRAAKRATTKKTSARKKATASKNLSAVKGAHNKSQVMSYIAEQTEVGKKEVKAVIESLAELMHRHLKKGGPGEFTVPGLMKCVVKRKPATKARKGINPFTGQEVMFKAKPARNVVKVRPLKKLKEMVE